MKRIPKSKIAFYRNPFNGARFKCYSDAFAYMHKCSIPFIAFRGSLRNDFRFLILISIVFFVISLLIVVVDL